MLRRIQWLFDKTEKRPFLSDWFLIVCSVLLAIGLMGWSRGRFYAGMLLQDVVVCLYALAFLSPFFLLIRGVVRLGRRREQRRLGRFDGYLMAGALLLSIVLWVLPRRIEFVALLLPARGREWPFVPLSVGIFFGPVLLLALESKYLMHKYCHDGLRRIGLAIASGVVMYGLFEIWIPFFRAMPV